MKYKALHKWKVTPKEAVKIQMYLAKKIIFKNTLKKLNYIAGADVSYKNGKSAACVCVLKYPELKCVEYKIATCRTEFPYVPGLLSFREGPAIIRCVKKILTKIDVIFFDGQGIAHPRKLGIATHMGILLDMPTIGCAKSFLYGKYEKDPGIKKGNFTFVKDRNRKIGVVLRSRDNIKPIYVSPGHKIDIPTSIEIILRSLTKYRIPEPLRMAHHLCKTILISSN